MAIYNKGVVERGMSRMAVIVGATVSPAATVAGQTTKRFIQYKYPKIVTIHIFRVTCTVEH